MYGEASPGTKVGLPMPGIAAPSLRKVWASPCGYRHVCIEKEIYIYMCMAGHTYAHLCVHTYKQIEVRACVYLHWRVYGAEGLTALRIVHVSAENIAVYKYKYVFI